MLQCCRVADDDRLLASGSVTRSIPVQSLGDDPGRSHHLTPVVGDVLVVRIVRVLQLLGANVAEHDAEREEAEHAHHEKDVQHALRLSASLRSSHIVHRLLGGVVLWYWWR